jgi:hypothetical protein
MNPLHSSLLAVAALAGLSATPAVAQTATMPPQTSVYNGQCRGYFFTAPVAFTITGVRVNQQTGVNNAFQNFAIVRFDGGSPPQWTATTNAFTQLVLRFDLDASAFQAVNVPVAAGDIIGVFGNTAPAAGWNFGFHSLAGQTIASMTTTIAGHPVHLRRAAMQAHLGLAGSSQGMHDIYFENSPMARIEFTYSVTNGTLGTRYCSPPVLNSLAHPGTLFVTGSAVASQNDVTLHASNLPLNAFGFFLCSRTQAQIAQPGGSLGAGEVIVEVAGCGVCHTDLGFYFDGVPTRQGVPADARPRDQRHRRRAPGRAPRHGSGAVVVPAVIPCGECARAARAAARSARSRSSPATTCTAASRPTCACRRAGSAVCPTSPTPRQPGGSARDAQR